MSNPRLHLTVSCRFRNSSEIKRFPPFPAQMVVPPSRKLIKPPLEQGGINFNMDSTVWTRYANKITVNPQAFQDRIPGLPEKKLRGTYVFPWLPRTQSLAFQKKFATQQNQKKVRFLLKKSHRPQPCSFFSHVENRKIQN